MASLTFSFVLTDTVFTVIYVIFSEQRTVYDSDRIHFTVFCQSLVLDALK